MGFAVSDPCPWFWLELLAVGVFGILPILWMQLTRPFDIFSLLFLAIKPEALTVNQQKILALFKRKSQKLLTVLTAGLMAWVLWLLYQWAPLAAIAAAQLPQWRLLGLLIAAVGFLISNLFVQVPVSVLGILLTSQDKLAAAEPPSPANMRQDFTILGIEVQKILPT
jgi:hypothetical protein